MTNVKLSQIASAPTAPALTDTVVGVHSGTTDYQYSLGQIQAAVGGGGSVANNKYVSVAASQSNQLLGSTGAIGDYFNDVLIIPATSSPGAITIKDGSGGSQITIFAGGTSSLNDLTPFTLDLGFPSRVGGWYITTGANVSVIAAGTFT